MIWVDRAKVPPPNVLIDAKRAGPKETRRAIDFYLKHKGKAPSFAAYKDKDVKDALELLFKKKCAYCECSYQAVTAFPVEHWRPKGRVTLDDGTELKLGYFWLAADWENLYASCNDCNGQREQVELPTGQKKLMGKLDRFPLADESKRAKAPGEEKQEVPLLLNPCIHKPADHLEFFDPDGERAILRPRAESGLGAKSIEIYALNRIGLVRERQELAKDVTLLKSQIDSNLKLLDTEVTPAQEAIIKQNIKDAMVALVEKRLPSKPYSALARREIDIYLEPLLNRFGLPPLP